MIIPHAIARAASVTCLALALGPCAASAEPTGSVIPPARNVPMMLRASEPSYRLGLGTLVHDSAKRCANALVASMTLMFGEGGGGAWYRFVREDGSRYVVGPFRDTGPATLELVDHFDVRLSTVATTATDRLDVAIFEVSATPASEPQTGWKTIHTFTKAMPALPPSPCR